MEILYTIWIIYSGLCVLFATVFLINLIRNIRREINIIEDVQQFKQNAKLVYVEQVDGMYRMHDKFTHHYICQASSEKEMWATADSMFPNVKIMSTTIEAEVTKQ
jgi:hypothetical protein